MTCAQHLVNDSGNTQKQWGQTLMEGNLDYKETGESNEGPRDTQDRGPETWEFQAQVLKL